MRHIALMSIFLAYRLTPQVQDAVGQWHDIELGAKQLLLMAGHALEHATCGLIRAGRHRVSADSGAARCTGGNCLSHMHV